MAREYWNRWQHRPKSLLSIKVESPVCMLDTLPELADQPQFKITGQTRRNGRLTVQVNAKVFGPLYADDNGRFEEWITLARQSNSISVKCEKEQPMKYAFPLALAPLFLDIYRFTADEWNSPYPILAFIFKISLTLCFWRSIAWFFGYFYRYILACRKASIWLSRWLSPIFV